MNRAYILTQVYNTTIIPYIILHLLCTDSTPPPYMAEGSTSNAFDGLDLRNVLPYMVHALIGFPGNPIGMLLVVIVGELTWHHSPAFVSSRQPSSYCTRDVWACL